MDTENVTGDNQRMEATAARTSFSLLYRVRVICPGLYYSLRMPAAAGQWCSRFQGGDAVGVDASPERESGR
jgi:hypothetical protein